MIKFSLFCEDGLFQNIYSNIHSVDTEEDPYPNKMKCQSDPFVSEGSSRVWLRKDVTTRRYTPNEVGTVPSELIKLNV